jgi:hypothetical protein
MLITPIAPQLFSDPIAAYTELAAGLAQGQKWVQEFDYSIVEEPQLTETKYLEEIYPQGTILGDSGDLGSWNMDQGSLGACGTFAAVGALASIKTEYRLENSIYPKEYSPHSLYLVRVQDPDDPFGVKWVAIDSKVPVNASGKSAFASPYKTNAIAGALFVKACATVKGGSYNEITNHPSFRKAFGWFPAVSAIASTFDEFADYLGRGGMFIFSMTQQYAVDGTPTKPLGVLYGHAYSAVDTIKATNADGTEAQLVRIENPWSEHSDFPSIYSETSPFWTEHPELEDKLNDAKQATGNYWVSWAEFKMLIGVQSFSINVPFPHPKYPHVSYFRHEFTGEPAFDHTKSLTPQLIANLPAETLPTVTLEAETTLTLDIKWIHGSGDRHVNLRFVDTKTNLTVGKLSEEVWWGGNGTRTATLPAGTYRIYPSTRDMNADRGVLQSMVFTEKQFGWEPIA